MKTTFRFVLSSATFCAATLLTNATVSAAPIAVAPIAVAPIAVVSNLAGKSTLVAPSNQRFQRQQRRGLEVTSALKAFLLRRISSPNGALTLRITPGARPDLGQFSEIVIAGAPAQLKKKMRVSDFSMRARDVRIDTAALMRREKPKLRTLQARTVARAVITEDDLTSMLAQGNTSKSMGLRVRFQGDRIRVNGNWNWGWFSGPVSMLGRLRLVKSANGNQVFFDILSLSLNGAQVPAFVQNKFSEKLNPLISYDDLPFLPQIRSIRFVGQKAILST